MIPKVIDNMMAWDTECTGLHPHRGDRPYLFSFCNSVGDTGCISFPVDPMTRAVLYQKNPEGLEELLNWVHKPIIKIAHNAQFDVRHTETALKTRIQGQQICTMNLIRLVRSNAPMKLKEFCDEYLGIKRDDETELKEAVKKERRMAKAKGWAIYHGDATDDGSIAPDYWLCPRLAEKYALTDAARCMAVYLSLRPEINKLGISDLWKKEKETWKVLRKIEKRGIRIHRDKVIAHKEAIKKKLLTYQKEAHQICGQQINLNSHPQLKKIFYEKLKEQPKYLTPTGSPSTDTNALRRMKHPLAKCILNMRACLKTIEFMDQYIFHMVPGEKEAWYIHPTIHQARATTGRESCSDPNLQQVASGRNDAGIEITVEARQVFGPRPGYTMRSYDWKNIEVFIPAFASKEPKLTNILIEGGDVHQNTADMLSELVRNKIARDLAKRIFFGLQYGIRARKLAKLLDLEEELAHQIVVGFREQYPILSMWMGGLINTAVAEGFIRTAYGRIIQMSREEAYKAPNYYTQGTAGSILKNSKIKIVREFERRKLDAHIVLPIHDEVLIEISEKDGILDEVDSVVVKCMQDNPELKMPISIPVSISAIGKDWSDKTKIKII